MIIRLTRDEVSEYVAHQNSTTAFQMNGFPDHAWIENNAVSILTHAAGIGADLMNTIKNRYGADASIIVLKDPFRLYSEISGITLQIANRLWRRTAISSNDNGQVKASMFEALKIESDKGHVYTDTELIFDQALTLTGAPETTIENVYKSCLRKQEFVRFSLLGISRTAIRRYVLEERSIASRVLEHVDSREFPYDDDQIASALRDAGCTTIDPSQIAAVRLCGSQQFALLTGGPGTGKTTILRAVESLITRLEPSGRAVCVSLAARVARSFHTKTNLAAETIHKYFEYQNGAFQRRYENPIDATLLFVEEAFMLDNQLTDVIMSALNPDCRVIMIGDPDQLEPIGRGRPIHILANSPKIPQAHLTTNHRCAIGSVIPISGQRAMKGRLPAPGDDIEIISTLTTAETMKVIAQAWKKAIETVGSSGVQILTATKDGPMGARAINNCVTERTEFAIGDRVMQNKNDRDADYFNGELGVITKIDQRGLTIITDSGTVVEYPGTNPASISKAYCITYHKAQGLEYPFVINVLHPTHKRMLTRSLINVAITRARQRCIIIDQQNQLVRALTHRPRHNRASLLDLILQDADPVTL